ncbi:MAG: DISARM system helicase DrmA [Chromatiaceae bacterium]|nr:DISARM system helicase DrmA [Chromatiaceae bacterium]MCF7994033.1 DISARM system helicase DrmA [Chromatiaceae bacterium]
MQTKPPAALRDELETLVINDLLGPAGGPVEEIDESQITDRYLIGKLAPRDQEIPRDQDDELAVADDERAEEGGTEPSTVGGESLYPSSIGLSFTLAVEAKTLAVSAEWGWYKREKSEEILTDKGNPKAVWRRYPMIGRVDVPVREGAVKPLVLNPEQPEVVLRGKMRRTGDGVWLVSLFLVNTQIAGEGGRKKGECWLFQPVLRVASVDAQAIFVRQPLAVPREHLGEAQRIEAQALSMLYRDLVEFAVGHTVAASWRLADAETQRAVELFTEMIPSYDVPQVTSATVDDNADLAGLVLDMKALAEMDAAALIANLERLPAAYRRWIGQERQRLASSPDLSAHAEAARLAMDDCERAGTRIAAGIALLKADAQALEAFQFANRAMWQQRVHSLLSESVRRGQVPQPTVIDQPPHRSWRLFQLAFILLNLPGCADLGHPDRDMDPTATADLLWFPTGGGKTEAYLGLTAFVLGLRRLQGVVAGRRGDVGVAVLMRYTLRLLTLQQFQRATALICACESIRREALAQQDARWGAEPFRIGLWVGAKTTPNTTERANEAARQHRGQAKGAPTGIASPAQLTNCPWCGSEIDPGKHLKVETQQQGRGRTLLFCGDPLGQCPFSEARASGEGLPVVVVDQEIYQHPPALMIATVDKFAQLPWRGETQNLFGQINRWCPRHGFLSPSVDHAGSHPARPGYGAVKVIDHAPLRPPDLIIQDELHLISGPLGSLVGLYETAIDRLSAWEVNGRWVRPKVIASTATIRQAQDQVHRVFMRRVEVFPPHGLDLGDNFFAIRRPPSPATPGRRYLGLCAPGERLKSTLIRTYIALLAAAQTLYDGRGYGAAVDPWMTLVGYFNSLRELGGMRRLIDDDIRARLRNAHNRGFSRRFLNPPFVEELTSRKQASDIPRLLDWLETPFDPAKEAARKARFKAGEGRRRDGRFDKPLDLLLATSMISVGVDVQRLGLMAVTGQPKNTSEYIQATSRVGRRFPGLVCTVYNWARPRDLSHYERFAHYHATFYQHVEALSVTPFASGALERGLAGVVVALIRLLTDEFNANLRAQDLDKSRPIVQEAMAAIVRRVEEIEGKALAKAVRKEIDVKLDKWLKQAQGQGYQLGYQASRDGTATALLRTPGEGKWQAFTTLHSLRDVEPSVGLILKER